MMSGKLIAAGLLKRKMFWNKSYGAISFAHDVTNRNLFGNSSISIREVIIASILWEFDQENLLFWVAFLVQVR